MTAVNHMKWQICEPNKQFHYRAKTAKIQKDEHILKMSKRANPFIEDYVTKSKIHVSLKQFNNNEDRLQKVYEKTLQILYKGAKKHLTPESHNSCETNSSYQKGNKWKQLFISKDGSLSHSGSMVDNKISLAKQCQCGDTTETQCTHCEVMLCASCLQSCVKCQRTYCPSCTVVGSEGSHVCFSCYS